MRVLDYRHCSLHDVPGEVFNFERTLEELLVDSNQIQDLPRVSGHIICKVLWPGVLEVQYLSISMSTQYFLSTEYR